MPDLLRLMLVPADPALPVSMVDVDHDHRALAAAIGADWIEHVRTPIPRLAMIVDEEGHVTGRPLNKRVSGVLYPGAICGDVLIASETHSRDGGIDVISLVALHVHQLDLVGLRAGELVDDA